MAISLYRSLHSQMVFPSNTARVLPVTFSPAIVASTSNGWCSQPWPGSQSWPMAPMIPKVLLGQALIQSSTGEGWLLSSWPGRGTWPYGRPTASLICQYSMQWAAKDLPSQVAQFLGPSQTNLGSNSTQYCARDFCSSGVFVENAWMFKSHFSQVVFYLQAQKVLRCMVLFPSLIKKTFQAQYYLEFPVDRVGPFTQIYCSTEPLHFQDSPLHCQYWAERARTLACQWKKRPF
jgi:hypothetical protein